VLAKYKHEAKGNLDFKGTGVDRRECRRESHAYGRQDHDDHDD
jgi:hypothetical protein